MPFIINSVDVPNQSLFPVTIVIDYPKPEIQYEGFLIRIAGWIRCSNQTVTLVKLYCNHFKLTEDSLKERVDVPVTPPQVALGFDFKITVWDLPKKFNINLLFSFNSGETLPLVTFQGFWQSPFLSTHLLPIFVNSVGRSGSSLMMRLMNAHENIVCGNQPPYELKLTRYLANFLNLLNNDRKNNYPFSPDDLYLAENKIGYNPFFNLDFMSTNMMNWCEEVWMHQWLTYTQSMIIDLYDNLAKDQSKFMVTSFAEKVYPSTHIYNMNFIFKEIKQIILVRDPRDNLVSRLCFNKIRNKDDFGFSKNQSLESYINIIYAEYEALIYNGLMPENTLLVYYEDLITKPEKIILSIFEFCNIKFDKKTVEYCIKTAFELDDFSSTHMTSNSPEQSIGRWKDYFDQHEQNLILENLNPILSQLGYLD